MTAGYGFGMLALGLVAIAIIGLTGFWIINRNLKNEKEEEQRKERNKVFGE